MIILASYRPWQEKDLKMKYPHRPKIGIIISRISISADVTGQ